MSEAKRSYEYKPFLIKYRVKDDWGKWGNWLVRQPAFSDEEARDAEFAKLSNRPFVEYERVTDCYELDCQARAMGRVK